MLYIGLVLGGIDIKGGLVNDDGELLYSAQADVKDVTDMKTNVSEMVNLYNKILEDTQIDPEEIVWVGVGCPGVCNPKTGTILHSSALDVDNYPLGAEISEQINKMVFVDNDANCSALGEAWGGATHGVSDSVFLMLSSVGLGSSVILGGKVHRGLGNAGGELGHMVIVADGEPCECGRRGCWEQYSSASALMRMTVRAAESDKDSLIWSVTDNDLKNVDGKTAFIAARKGDKTAQEVVETYINYLSEGIANIINIFMPEKIVLGGGIGGEGSALLEPLREKVYDKIYMKDPSHPITIVSAMLGQNAGIIGAAMLGM